MRALFSEAPGGSLGGVVFRLTNEGRSVWDGERGQLAQAKLAVQLVRRGWQLTPAHRLSLGVPGPVVRYDAAAIGVPPSSKLEQIKRAHSSRPSYCREPGVSEVLGQG
jgi:hypothetical protein